MRRFWNLAWEANITGNSAMLAYNMLVGIVPVALLSLFVAGQVLSSSAVQHSVLEDLRAIFPGSTEQTLNSLLTQIKSSTTSTGVLALVFSLWLAGSFWGARPPSTKIGESLWLAEAIALIPFVTPGPAVSAHTPG